jgi:hypothetical protein
MHQPFPASVRSLHKMSLKNQSPQLAAPPLPWIWCVHARYCLQYIKQYVVSIKKMGRQKLEEWPAPVIERVTAGVMCAIHLCLLARSAEWGSRRFYAYHRWIPDDGRADKLCAGHAALATRRITFARGAFFLRFAASEMPLGAFVDASSLSDFISEIIHSHCLHNLWLLLHGVLLSVNDFYERIIPLSFFTT